MVRAAVRLAKGRVFHERLSCAEANSSPTRLVVSDASELRRAGGRPCSKCWTGKGYVPAPFPERWERAA